MRSEQAFCKAAGFEQRVAQQHRVAHALPDRHGNIIPHGDILYQHRIDADADHNKKCLKAKRQQGLQVVFVCLGAPKQEKWMAKNGTATGARLLCGLGGSLDVFAGVVERAPKFWTDHGLEWFYRLCKEPRRIGRMMKLPLFLIHVKQEKRHR